MHCAESNEVTMPKHGSRPAPDRDTFDLDLYEIDQQLVEQLKAQALIDAGYSSQDEDGLQANPKLMSAAVVELMQANHVVKGKRDLATHAVTKFELYAEVLPNGPGVNGLATQPEGRIAQADLMKQVWTLTNTGTSGLVQKHVGPTGQVLCEADVGRTKISEETGKRQAMTEPGRFLTTDRELIMTYYTAPAGAAFIRAARRLEAQLGLVGERRPELVEAVARQASVAMKQAMIAVPHADIKQAAALIANDDNEVA